MKITAPRPELALPTDFGFGFVQGDLGLHFNHIEYAVVCLLYVLCIGVGESIPRSMCPRTYLVQAT